MVDPTNSMSVQEELAEFEPCDDRTPLDDRDECGDLECYVCYPFLQDDVELRVPLLEMSR